MLEKLVARGLSKPTNAYNFKVFEGVPSFSGRAVCTSSPEERRFRTMTAMVPEATTVLNKKPIMKVLVHKFGAEGNERSSIKDTPYCGC